MWFQGVLQTDGGIPPKLAQAGIKLWVLTRDKMETTVNIGYVCSLLREGIRQIVISSEAHESKELQKASDKSAMDEVNMMLLFLCDCLVRMNFANKILNM